MSANLASFDPFRAATRLSILERSIKAAGRAPNFVDSMSQGHEWRITWVGLGPGRFNHDGLR
jgi:hypothetical protein